MNQYDCIKEARELLENLTPLKRDCGRYCGGACCEADESGENGMRLLPGEEAFYDHPTEDFPYRLLPDSTYGENGKRLVCDGYCQRENRPFACRIFPLRIRIREDSCGVEIDPRAWAVCPLAERGGLQGMSEDFRKAVKAAGELLLQDPEIRQALWNEQLQMDGERYL